MRWNQPTICLSIPGRHQAGLGDNPDELLFTISLLYDNCLLYAIVLLAYLGPISACVAIHVDGLPGIRKAGVEVAQPVTEGVFSSEFVA